MKVVKFFDYKNLLFRKVRSFPGNPGFEVFLPTSFPNLPFGVEIVAPGYAQTSPRNFLFYSLINGNIFVL